MEKILHGRSNFWDNELWENGALASLNLGVALYQVYQSGLPKDVKLDINAKEPLLKARKEIERKMKLLYCNPTYVKQSGFEKEALFVAKDTFSLCERVGLMSSEMSETLWNNVCQDRSWNGIQNWKRPDGQKSIVEFNDSPFNYNGTPYILGIHHDITHHIRSKSELQQRYEWLIGSTQHAVFPLAMVNHALKGHPQKDFVLSLIKKTCGLSSGAGDFADLDSDQILLVPQWSSVQLICQGLGEFFAVQLKEKRLVLELDFPDEPVKLWIDPSAVSRMLQNLLRNAIELTSKDKIRLKCEFLGGTAPAKGVEWSVSAAKVGLLTSQGIHGLKIVQELAQRMEGSLRVESSKMSVRLPQTSYLVH
jgi:PAS domain S-box-containing protein